MRAHGDSGDGVLRRLDHVAILVRDLDEALGYYRDRLGLAVESTETNADAGTRVAYLDAGSVLLQLIEPQAADSPLGRTLAAEGEGVHHLCFSVDDVEAGGRALADDGAAFTMGPGGRGRASAFVPGRTRHGVRVELNEFRLAADVRDRRGYLGT